MKRLQEAEKERVRRSLEFSNQIKTQEETLKDQERRARIALEESIRQEMAEVRKKDVATFVAREIEEKKKRDEYERVLREQEFA